MDHHIVVSRPNQAQLRTWFESLINDKSHNEYLIFDGRLTFFRDDGNSVTVANVHGDAWTLPYSTIPKFIAALK